MDKLNSAEFTAEAGEVGRRLDRVLAEKFSQHSRVYLKQQIKLGNILVNQKKVKQGYFLRQGDIVSLAQNVFTPLKTAIAPNPAIKLDVIFENDDVIVIDKPAGLSVHPRQGRDGKPLDCEADNTLVSGLLARYPLLAGVGDAPAIRPGLVHRLDKDTSGLMIVAKNQPSFEWLKKEFQARRVHKTYIALVEGAVADDKGAIMMPLARSKSDPAKQKIDRNGKIALTEYKVIKRYVGCTLLEVSPQTGRLHQIRVHLAWLGRPVAGDKKYGQKKQTAPAGLARQFLHAAELEITLPGGEKRKFSSPLPADLAATLAGLEKKSDK